MSKQIDDYVKKHPDKFESWHIEDNEGPGTKDYWVYCRDPYFSPDMECQTIHEWNVKDTLARMKDVVKGKRVHDEQTGWSGWEALIGD